MLLEVLVAEEGEEDPATVVPAEVSICTAILITDLSGFAKLTY